MSRRVPPLLREVGVTSRDWTRDEAVWRRDRRSHDQHDVYAGAYLELYVGRGRRTERARRFLAGSGEYDETQWPF